MTLILLLSASRHDKHDTHYSKTKHTTHPASSQQYVYYHASFFTQYCRSDVITTSPSPFLQRHDHRCSSFQLCNPICCCGLGSCCTFLPAFNPSLSNPFHPPPAHQHHYSWLDCLMLLVVVFLPRVIRHHSPQLHKKKNLHQKQQMTMPPLSTT